VIVTPDTDGDGIPNVWEREHGLDLDGDDAADDPDDDGLTNSEEFELDTDPQDDDSDDDSLPDGWEVDNDLDPTDGVGDNADDGDPDGDGLTNREELELGTIPTGEDGYDSDRDGVSDGAEVRCDTDPLDGRDSPVDINGSGSPDAVDVQLVINAVLGLDIEGNADVNRDNEKNAVDVQVEINCVLGLDVSDSLGIEPI